MHLRPFLLKSFSNSSRPFTTIMSITSSNTSSTIPSQQGFITGYNSEKSTGPHAGKPQISVSSAVLTNEVKETVRTLLERTNAEGKKDEHRIFYNVDSSLPFQFAAANLGTCKPRSIYEKREAIRRAAANAVRSLSSQGIKEYILDSFSDPQAAVEGAILSSYSYLKFAENCKSLSFKIVPGCTHKDIQAFKCGYIMASAQNLVRYLADMPANLCTPTKFVEMVQKFAKDHLSHVSSHLKIEAKDAEWAKSQGMNSFLSVARGSSEPCKFLIMEYHGRRANNLPSDNESPIGLVGKGVTFDSGGISIKPSANMASMKADMQGAAVMATSFLTAAFCKLPLDLVAAIPLTENLPSGTATKPGDVIIASNGKSIEIDNTDAEGRLILADALVYIKKYSPSVIIDAATLTGAISVALGTPTSAIFTNCDNLFKEMEEAGSCSGDRIWRMPLWDDYRSPMDSTVADMKNSSSSRAAGACTAAAFLREFVEEGQTWAHLDIAGTMENSSECGALGKGMSGRPTRMILYWLLQRANTTKPDCDISALMESIPEEKICVFGRQVPLFH